MKLTTICSMVLALGVGFASVATAGSTTRVYIVDLGTQDQVVNSNSSWFGCPDGTDICSFSTSTTTYTNAGDTGYMGMCRAGHTSPSACYAKELHITFEPNGVGKLMDCELRINRRGAELLRVEWRGPGSTHSCGDAGSDVETDGEGVWASEVIALGNIHNKETIVLKTGETGGEGWFTLNGLQLICDVAGNESFDDF